jgi:hypothetical protein
MQTIVIELVNDRALRLLQDLEDLHLIRLQKKSTIPEKESLTEEIASPSIIRKKASEFKGILSPEMAVEMQTHVKQSREEWRQGV